MNNRTINELEYAPHRQEPDAKWAAVVSLSLGVFGLVTAEFLPVSLLTPLSTDLSSAPALPANPSPSRHWSQRLPVPASSSARAALIAGGPCLASRRC